MALLAKTDGLNMTSRTIVKLSQGDSSYPQHTWMTTFTHAQDSYIKWHGVCMYLCITSCMHCFVCVYICICAHVIVVSIIYKFTLTVTTKKLSWLYTVTEMYSL